MWFLLVFEGAISIVEWFVEFYLCLGIKFSCFNHFSLIMEDWTPSEEVEGGDITLYGIEKKFVHHVLLTKQAMRKIQCGRFNNTWQLEQWWFSSSSSTLKNT